MGRGRILNILLSFVGSRDPFWRDEAKNQHPGPVLSLLRERAFDCLHLFFNLGAGWNQRASQVLMSCHQSHPHLRVKHQPVEIIDVTDHAELYQVMNHECQAIRRQYINQDVKFWVATASGTPAMQTVWVLLVQSGLLPATLLVTTPPQWTKPGVSPVREVNLNIDDFPQIQSPDEAQRQLSILQTQIQILKTQNATLRAKSLGAQLEISGQGMDLQDTLRQHEVAYFRLAMERAGGNGAKAARLLGLKPHTFRKRAVDLGVWNRRSRRE